MENLDLMVLRTLRNWRQAGQHGMLATVIRTWGSSPRPVGSIMALREDGTLIGSVSGGCIEDDLIHRYAHPDTSPHTPERLQPPSSGAPTFATYGVSADEAHRFGLPCGGTLELLLEYNPDPTSLATLVSALEAGQLMHRSVHLAGGTVTLEPAQAPTGLTQDTHRITNTFGPEYRMLLIGAGQLAEYLATMAQFSGFAVTVCDPREEYRGTWSVAGVRIVSDMPDDAVTAFQPDRRSCIIALSHDPKLDDLALLEALGSPAFYIGGIGSRRNNAARHVRLAEHFGATPDTLARLRGPIGLYIGSKTPPEIAVSVMAEVLAVKNGVALPREMTVGVAKDGQEVVPDGAGVCGVPQVR